jgi:hypothetical protein
MFDRATQVVPGCAAIGAPVNADIEKLDAVGRGPTPPVGKSLQVPPPSALLCIRTPSPESTPIKCVPSAFCAMREYPPPGPLIPAVQSSWAFAPVTANHVEATIKIVLDAVSFIFSFLGLLLS